MDNITKKYPRVLIIGCTFEDSTANGVTLYNLFADWPKEQLAVADWHVDEDFCQKNRQCSMYYSFFSKTKKTTCSTKAPKRPLVKVFFHFIAHWLVERIGFWDIVPESRMTDKFLSFVNDFSPDIIYTPLGTLRQIKFIEQLHQQTHIPLAIHIWDDWVTSSFINTHRWFTFIWKRVYNQAFRRILAQTTVRMTICKTMSDEYKQRYGFDFEPFHNPVDTTWWKQKRHYPAYSERLTSFLYAGKINRDTLTPLLEMCEAVERLNQEGTQVGFDIYSPRFSDDLQHKFSKYTHSRILPALPHTEMPELLEKYVGLFLCLGFSRRSIRYTRLSMPTKISEYMISGTPILLYCPPELALYKYCKENKIAYISEKGTDHLKQGIQFILNHDDFTEKITQKALSTVTEELDCTIIRKRFLDVFKPVIG